MREGLSHLNSLRPLNFQELMTWAAWTGLLFCFPEATHPFSSLKKLRERAVSCFVFCRHSYYGRSKPVVTFKSLNSIHSYLRFPVCSIHTHTLGGPRYTLVFLLLPPEKIPQIFQTDCPRSAYYFTSNIWC